MALLSIELVVAVVVQVLEVMVAVALVVMAVVALEDIIQLRELPILVEAVALEDIQDQIHRLVELVVRVL
jgi:hypothetical protein